MSTVNADLLQVLNFRDERVAAQERIRAEHRCPIISFTMNIAGPVKRSALIDFVFDHYVRDIPRRLGEAVFMQEIRGIAGNAAIFAYNADAAALKKACISMEDEQPAGRLLDLDVIDTDGVKLSREDERRCIICGGPAAPCARSRRHALADLTDKTNRILWEYAENYISNAAVNALLSEARLTPKPGLVDNANSGAHKDMDLALMEKSALSLRTYFSRAAALGFTMVEECAHPLQALGVEAEKTMFSATNGVNTHKGAIFSTGILCAALGLELSGHGSGLRNNASHIAAGLRPSSNASHGQTVKSKYGGGGAREEASAGFPNVFSAFEILQNGGTEHEALLYLIKTVHDTNILWRGGESALAFMQKRAGEILISDRSLWLEQIKALDDECIKMNISPGGAADMLASAIFLYDATNGTNIN